MIPPSAVVDLVGEPTPEFVGSGVEDEPSEALIGSKLFEAPKVFLRRIELYDSSKPVLFVSDFYSLLG